jgi:hypothetical protein
MPFFHHVFGRTGRLTARRPNLLGCTAPRAAERADIDSFGPFDTVFLEFVKKITNSPNSRRNRSFEHFAGANTASADRFFGLE